MITPTAYISLVSLILRQASTIRSTLTSNGFNGVLLLNDMLISELGLLVQSWFLVCKASTISAAQLGLDYYVSA